MSSIDTSISSRTESSLSPKVQQVHISSKKQTLVRALSLVSFMTLLSRLTGFTRDVLLAHFFGAGAGLDAFFVAFRIPNFLRSLFAEGAFSQAFIPILTELEQKGDKQALRAFIAKTAGLLSAVLGLITCLGILSAPFLVRLFAPGFEEVSERSLLCTDMLRLTFPFLFFISLTVMAGAILNTFGNFGIPAFTPIILNLSLIAATVFLNSYFMPPVLALAFAVFIGGFLQLLFQLFFLQRQGLLVKPKLVWGDFAVGRVLKLMLPALFGASATQINLMIDSIFASYLPIGSVSWLYYTDRLTQFPLGIFGIAMTTVILPHLSKRFANKNLNQFSLTLDWGLRLILLIAIPSALALAFFASPIIASCLAYGKFSLHDLIETKKSLIALSLGIPAFMMVKILASGFFACQDVKTPVKIGILTLAFNSFLCCILYRYLAHAGLALASMLASYLNCAALFLLLRQRQIYQAQKGWFRYLGQLAFANTLMVIYLISMNSTIQVWFNRPLSTRIGFLLIHVILSSLIYLQALYISGLRPKHLRHPQENE